MPFSLLGLEQTKCAISMSRACKIAIPLLLKFDNSAGRHFLEDTPSEAALTLVTDGVVKIVSSAEKKHMLQISAPLLEQLLQAMALRDVQAAVQLPNPPMELGQRQDPAVHARCQAHRFWAEMSRLHVGPQKPGVRAYKDQQMVTSKCVPGRSLGVYLFESAISLLDVPRLLQPRVATAKNQILEYALHVKL